VFVRVSNIAGACIMQHFVIRVSTAEYLTKVRIVSQYLEYEFTTNRDEASVLNDSDSQLILKRLRTLGETRARREETED
jgi:hypothetical protein